MKRSATAVSHLAKMAPKLLTLSSVRFNPTLSLGVMFPNCNTKDMVTLRKTMAQVTSASFFAQLLLLGFLHAVT
jgi:hypothetical protein